VNFHAPEQLNSCLLTLNLSVGGWLITISLRSELIFEKRTRFLNAKLRNGWLKKLISQCFCWLGIAVSVRNCFLALPGFDEAYYYLYSLHLDWSYFDHPVLVALTGFGPWVTGVIPIHDSSRSADFAYR